MMSLALMRWLEAAPARYDAAMRLVTLGRVDVIHEAVAEAAADRAGRDVLEIGCGTGSVTERLLSRGATVTAIDENPEMIERARARLGGRSEHLELLERGAAEIDRLPEAGCDAVVASLSLSEMSTSERAFVLREARRRLRAGGRLVIADEVLPQGVVQRFVFRLLRVPQAAIAWLGAGQVSKALPRLREEIAEAGFRVVDERRWLAGSLALFVAVLGD
jgi:ubiquinone/menaquinone biosynthesis C-methylase UbiE